ncbi:MAG: bifunctional succinylornithine transaminase/acetylornithine transaminase [Francisella sp.]|mgnify:CR=1 FL=1|jgi:acetylornithine transaminase|nr:MAG: bifunctional succinylornithine transaminase/acetylornithine transaminase [Francisella sp.]
MENFITSNFTFADILPVRGQGDMVWDQQGKDYIDFVQGIAVNALGHCHPDLTAALKKQAQQLWQISNLFTTEPAQELARKLVEATFAQKVFFANSGAEANEAALKLARKFAFDTAGPQKNKIVSCTHSFHGRSLFTVSVGGTPAYQEGFAPLPGAISHIPFNDCEALEEALTDDTCAFIAEPIQGEGGVVPAEVEFLKTARDLCNEHDIVFIMDEVQTGMGRTGSLFAYQQYRITPDILTAAKALGGGMPLGAMLTIDLISEHFTPGSHGTTMGGNPLACAVGSTAFDLINKEEIFANVKKQHQHFKDTLQEIGLGGFFGTIRGRGLLIGAVLNEPYAGLAGDIRKAALKSGLIINQAGDDVIRFTPALNISDEAREEGLERFKQTLMNWKKKP